MRNYEGVTDIKWDIGAIYGILPNECTDPFKTNLSLCVNIIKNPKIFSSSYFFSNKPIKYWPNIKLGTVDSYLGPIGLFIVSDDESNTEGENIINLFLKNISILAEAKITEASEVNTLIASDDANPFLKNF